MKPVSAAGALIAVAITLTACTSASEPTKTSTAQALEHVHGIAQDPGSDNLFVASHNGIFTVTPEGTVAGPVGGYDFDAMGFTVSGESLFASGHPGPETPLELGSPNLGIIRSDDVGESWEPVALTNDEDFHVLTAGPDGVLYGIGSSHPNLVISTDGGATWAPQASITAADLVATKGGLYAATEQGLQRSTDNGVTFTLIADAPLMYLLAATSTGTLIGAATDGSLWSETDDGSWEQIETLSGNAQALGITVSDQPVIVDDRGIVAVTDEGTKVLSPVSQ